MVFDSTKNRRNATFGSTDKNVIERQKAFYRCISLGPSVARDPICSMLPSSHNSETEKMCLYVRDTNFTQPRCNKKSFVRLNALFLYHLQILFRLLVCFCLRVNIQLSTVDDNPPEKHKLHAFVPKTKFLPKSDTSKKIQIYCAESGLVFPPLIHVGSQGPLLPSFCSNFFFFKKKKYSNDDWRRTRCVMFTD